jgi:hypothetical protein
MIAIGMICKRKDDIRKTCHFDAGFPTCLSPTFSYGGKAETTA